MIQAITAPNIYMHKIIQHETMTQIITSEVNSSQIIMQKVRLLQKKKFVISMDEKYNSKIIMSLNDTPSEGYDSICTKVIKVY